MVPDPVRDREAERDDETSVSTFLICVRSAGRRRSFCQGVRLRWRRRCRGGTTCAPRRPWADRPPRLCCPPGAARPWAERYGLAVRPRAWGRSLAPGGRIASQSRRSRDVASPSLWKKKGPRLFRGRALVEACRRTISRYQTRRPEPCRPEPCRPEPCRRRARCRHQSRPVPPVASSRPRRQSRRAARAASSAEPPAPPVAPCRPRRQSCAARAGAPRPSHRRAVLVVATNSRARREGHSQSAYAEKIS